LTSASYSCSSPPTGAQVYGYNAGQELTGISGGATDTYAYTADGQRCWSSASSVSSPSCGSPPSGASTYGWSANGKLCYTATTSSTGTCASPPSGATSYTYNGDGLRMSESGGTTASFTWDQVTGGDQPELLDDGTNAYIYGPNAVSPIEQISGSGTATFW